jgi:acrylyl-CoA reductase (NADPH)/3-hydroxypropionyl-CoA dehydratase/3-hydroxypropionyl-CoA synthetase
VGLEAIEAVRAAGGRLVVATARDAQREFVQSLGFGDAVKGVVSLEEIQRKEGADFEWPESLPAMPDAKTDTAAFKEAVRRFQERTMKPFGTAIGRWLRSADNPRGYPDLVIERAGHDALAASTSLVKPFTGRVVYCEELKGRRYTFYAPQVWTRQRRILMPTATIAGTHLCNAFEVTKMNDLIAAGRLDVSPPTAGGLGAAAAGAPGDVGQHPCGGELCGEPCAAAGFRTCTRGARRRCAARAGRR